MILAWSAKGVELRRSNLAKHVSGWLSALHATVGEVMWYFELPSTLMALLLFGRKLNNPIKEMVGL